MRVTRRKEKQVLLYRVCQLLTIHRENLIDLERKYLWNKELPFVKMFRRLAILKDLGYEIVFYQEDKDVSNKRVRRNIK